MSLQATTSQTVGPFFSIGLKQMETVELAGRGASGQRVTITGCVLDGDGKPVPDAILEIWQANCHGKYAHPEDDQTKPLDPAFRGYGRIPVDENGRFSFSTIKPGSVPGPDGAIQAPHIAVSVFMRGLLRRLVTRIYFPEETANAGDFILRLVAPERQATLIARKNAKEAGTLEWDVILQGPGETVFFDIGL